jgi:hypothetical protein
MINVGDLVRIVGQTGLRHMVGLVFAVHRGDASWGDVIHVRWVCDGSEVADMAKQFEVITSENR